MQKLADGLNKYSRRGFSYKAYVYEDSVPNAFALPGGVIAVSSGLLETMENESAVFAVLAHEMGHVELRHCIDAVRYEVLAKKTGNETLGELADLAWNLFFRYSFSKAQERDADDWAWKILLVSEYNPGGLALAFEGLAGYYDSYSWSVENKAHPVRDYFSSHPPLKVRMERYREESQAWWDRQSEGRRYDGRRNLTRRIPLSGRAIGKEWRSI